MNVLVNLNQNQVKTKGNQSVTQPKFDNWAGSNAQI